MTDSEQDVIQQAAERARKKVSLDLWIKWPADLLAMAGVLEGIRLVAQLAQTHADNDQGQRSAALDHFAAELRKLAEE